VKLPDTNVLLYAANSQSTFHERARQWMDAACNAPEGVGFAWSVLLGFIRISTRPGIFPIPLSAQAATGMVGRMLEAPQRQILAPGPDHFEILSRLLAAAGTAGNLTSDAHLAALAIEHSATIGTIDADFKRFAGLRVELLRQGCSA